MALEDLYGKILAQSVDVIREQTYLPAMVNHTSGGDRTMGATRGGVVEVIVPPEFQSRPVQPGATAPASDDAPAPNTVPITLDHWEEVNFPLTQQQITQMENADADIPMFLRNAVSPIVEEMTSTIAQTMKGVYGVAGVAGTLPFGVSPLEAQNAKRVLTRQKCPRFDRKIVLSTDAYANATGLPAFAQALNYGSAETIREGEIRRAYGFDWCEDVGIDGLTHENPNGTPTGWLVDGSVTPVTVGMTTMVIDTGANDPVEGDIFSVAGDDQTYVVKSFAPGGSVTFAPAAQVAWADNSALTFLDAHGINMAFHPMAFAFDSRPTVAVRLPGVTNNHMVWVDEMTGIALRLEIRDEHYQLGFYLSCLWGTKLVDPRLACRILA